MERLRIATRRSPLALWQAQFVADALVTAHPGLDISLVPMTTKGDELQSAPLAKVGGKGLFMKELEHALLDERADIAVHSIKDVTVDLPEGLQLPVISEREDPRDALVSRSYPCLDELPEGAVVGTSSLRRRCQLLALRPDIRILNLRGSVHTRLAKLDADEYDAIVLASAGLHRLGMLDRVTEYFDAERLLPAVGQGALGIECREGDAEVEGLIGCVHDNDTAQRVLAEREMNRALGGGCQVPVAGYADWRDGGLRLRGLVSSPDASEIIREEGLSLSHDVEALGRSVAQAMLARGAGEILAQVYADG